MKNREMYNSSGCLDMTAYLALRNIENEERRLKRMKDDWNYRRGDIYIADLGPYYGSEQGGTRPVLIVQNDTGNRHSPTVIAAAITSQTGKAKLPTHINIAGGSVGLSKDSIILLEQIRTIDKRRLREHMGHLDEQQMAQVDDAIAVSFGLPGTNRAT